MKKLLIILFLWTQLIALVINPGTDIRTTTGSDISFGVTTFNKRFITLNGTDYADVSAFIPSVVLGDSSFSISFWKKYVDGGVIIGSFSFPTSFHVYCTSTSIDFMFGGAESGISMDANSNWENIILTYDKINIIVYVDNVYKGTEDIGDVSDGYSSIGLFIGGQNMNGSFDYGFTGSIDEVAIYEKVLTTEDRIIIMGGGTVQTAGDCREISDLKAYWRFEEKAGSAVSDWAE